MIDSTTKRETHEITSRGQWLDLRRADLTASRIAALWDAHPYLTRQELVGSMLGTHNEGDSSAMRRGRILEPAVAVALAEDHPDWIITKATTYHRLPELRLGATPDYWLTDEHGIEGVVQIKTCSPEIWDKWHGRVPLAYSLQTLTELLVTGRQRGVLAIMITSRSLPVYEYEIPRHPAAEEKLLTAAAEWWQAFDRGEIAAGANAEPLEALLDDGSSIDLSADNWLPTTLPERQALKATISHAEKRVTEIDAHLKAAMGRATYGHLPGWTITYRAHQRAERVMPAATIRTLRVAQSKEEETL